MSQSRIPEKASDTDCVTRPSSVLKGMERLERLGSDSAVPKNFIVIEPGVVPDCCYVVKKGRVIVFDYTPHGEARVYDLMEERSLFLEANLLTNTPSYAYFKTTMPSELVCIGREALLLALREDPALMSGVIESIAYKFLSSVDQIKQSRSYTTTWKVCNLLLTFADRFGAPYDGKTLIREKISQRMISNFLGINRVTTVRIFKDLKDLNLIEQINGYYCIRDTTKLKQHMKSIG
ncbi:MAG: Crp/Fnr family transcriptional regulator [Synergistaceae bacterium]|jgi:CRP/FNR family transcriptional regulator|nr:Crp/Fnr family transcriptional regulator [Synergistaceae bacterium]